MSQASKIRVGIAGAAGYTGGELLRILIFHPQVSIVFAHSKSQAGKPVHSAHPDLFGDTELRFAEQLDPAIDVLFLCLGHGESKVFLQQNPLPESVRVVDLSQDFRVGQAKRIANPGCFATCIQLGLLPLAANGLLRDTVHINATTGSTGAGQSLSATSHFSWRANNLSSYKTFEHQHLAEIGANLTALQPDFEQELLFVPMRGAFTRGILATMYTRCERPLEEMKALYAQYYQGAPFTHLAEAAPDLKPVINTNKCFVHLQKHGDNLLITSVIDNLLKGASGQAVQNMNLLFGLEETAGLRLKAVAF